MAKIIYVVSDNKDIELKVISKKKVNHLDLCGRRASVVLIDKELVLDEAELLELKCLLYDPFGLINIMHYEEELK